MKKTLEYLESEYGHDPDEYNIHRLAAMYSPLLLLNETETQQQLAANFEDAAGMLKKKNFAYLAFSEIAQRRDLSSMSIPEAFRLADEFIQSLPD